jgi:hypothetical protein
VPIVFRRDGREFERRVRLTGMHREGELEALLESHHEPPVPDRPKPDEERKPGEQRNPGDKPPGKDPGDPPKLPGGRGALKNREAKMPRAVKDHFEKASGYANYWFNRYNQQRVWNAYLARGDFAETGWDWNITAQTKDGADVAIKLTRKDGKITMPQGESGAKFGPSLANEQGPPRSGGLLASIHLWQRLLLYGPRRFGEVYYLGTLPWGDEHAMADCLVGLHGGVESRFHFNLESGDLIGIEMQAADDLDTCEIYFGDIREIDGRRLPHQWTIRHGDEPFAELTIKNYEIAPAKPADGSK